MSTPSTLPAGLPEAPTIPLTTELRAAYQALYDKYETAIESTTDANLLTSLNVSQNAVESILNADTEYRLKANTKLYTDLLKQINSTNNDLKALQAQMLAISSGISTFGDILGAIAKVLTLVPGA